MKTYLLVAAAVIAQPALSVAQGVAPAGFQQAQYFEPNIGAGIQWPVAMAGRWMAGKPYSAVAVTHTVQTLANGPQIEQAHSQADLSGRTRPHKDR